jgi:hypothetical protein
MNSLTLFLSSSTLSADQSTILSAAPIKGRTTVTLDFTGFDETSFVVNHLKIDWGDIDEFFDYNKPPVQDYTTSSIFNEILYGKLNGSIMTQYSHEFNSLSSIDINTYLVQVFAYYENGWRHDISIFLPVYPESYYDTLDELDITSTQITPLSTNYTVVNLESRATGQTLVCVLSS